MGLKSVVDFLAKLGLTIRDDPPKVIDFAARQWGEAKNGWALSVETTPGKDPGDLPSLSIVIRNVGARPQKLSVPVSKNDRTWIQFYTVDLREANGTEVPMAPFGKTALDPARRTELFEAELAPGAGNETMIPLGSFFNLRGKSNLQVTAKATVATGVNLISNVGSV